MDLKRGSGILLHITSLPGQGGIGNIGRPARDFIDYLADYEQKYWQLLPTGPCSRSFHNSPYMSVSACAGNSLFISFEELIEDGFVSAADCPPEPEYPEYSVDFDLVTPFMNSVLAKAFSNFQKQGKHSGFDTFTSSENWLDDYALFMALREENELRPWNQWPRAIATRDPKAVNQARKRLAAKILYHKFVQFLFFHQWSKMHEYAKAKNVKLIGDIPIYVAMDSADVWANQECFRLNRYLSPTHVAGVPPDYFSETGQRWGNPLYKWVDGNRKINTPLYNWWRERFKCIFKTVDIVRIDHFRGFEAYWEIPAKEKTAVKGKWVKGPGKSFFMRMARSIGSMPIIAEDLGVITPEVEKLRSDLGFPGMKILQFAFDSDENNFYLPHNYESANCVVYTGTHDNDTSLGWHMSPNVAEKSKDRMRRYSNSDRSQVHWDFIKLAFSSVAKIAIIPLQDVLGFGSDCRMNTPSTTEGNWSWRCSPRFLTVDVGNRLKDETIFYGRAGA